MKQEPDGVGIDVAALEGWEDCYLGTGLVSCLFFLHLCRAAGKDMAFESDEKHDVHIQSHRPHSEAVLIAAL